MTKDVICVSEDTTFIEIVETLAEHRISAVPVVGTARAIKGIVTEADLLLKEELRDELTERPLFERPKHRRARAKATAADARGVMTGPAVTVAPGATVQEASRLMAEHGFKQLPVVDEDGALVGIVSRADLLTVFLRSDDDIRNEIIREVLVDALWQDPSKVHVRVEEGVVSLSGRVALRSLVPIAIRLTAATEGVVDVIAQLGYEDDDTHPGPYARA